MTGMQVGSYEPRHDKTNKMSVRQAKTPISLDIRPVTSDSSLSAWRNLGSLATHWVHSEVSDQTGWMPRLMSLRWVHSHFVGFVMSWLICKDADEPVQSDNPASLLFKPSHKKTCFGPMRTTMAQISLHISWAGQFESYLVENPEGWFSRDMAHLLPP